MDTSKSPRRRAKAFSQWDAIKAARAFYGRPLSYDEIQKVKAAYVENAQRDGEGGAQPNAVSRRAPQLPRALFIG
jgi:hypothetical protein